MWRTCPTALTPNTCAGRRRTLPAGTPPGTPTLPPFPCTRPRPAAEELCQLVRPGAPRPSPLPPGAGPGLTPAAPSTPQEHPLRKLTHFAPPAYGHVPVIVTARTIHSLDPNEPAPAALLLYGPD